MFSLGLDIGYSSVKGVLFDRRNAKTIPFYALHKGDVKKALRSCMEVLRGHCGAGEIGLGAVTGRGGKFLCRGRGLAFVNEVTAVLEGSMEESGTCRSVIEIGGQSAKYMTDFRGETPSGVKISMNTDCSAGTGSFLEEQLSRLKLGLEDYAPYAQRAASVPRIAGRCSVFAKTDITHHQQKGVPVEDILAGLAHAMVRNYRGSVMGKLPRNKPILFVGGVAHNRAIVDALKSLLGLAEGELIVPAHFAVLGALGAAVVAEREGHGLDMTELLDALEQEADCLEEDPHAVPLAPLASYGTDDSLGKHDIGPLEPAPEHLQCYLGVDVGSTSTNLVLTDRADRMVSFQYLRTRGNPLEAVRRGLKAIREEFGDRLEVIGVGTTGSGRHLIGRFVGADVIKDEITSQARAAVHLDPGVDTIFEIGGQDSKFVALEQGVVRDFQMNKICAAGTGSFIEEQAVKFSIPIEDLGPIALQSANPVALGERCTVFMETSIASHLSRGAPMKDIASGLCYSIVRNYLNRVVGQKRIGKHVFLQGGIAYNQGVVNAFRALTGKSIHVPPFF
ncbi:MAG: CoA activase, partial [Deltaproteobacteria bacterium]|nr:CoA activase [Deltaproteobacteria bacterium]